MTFGLVTIPVEAVNALDPRGGEVHFHQIHKECDSRIQYRKVCPIHGEVPKDEIVMGYEYRKGKYVELDPEGIAAARSEADRQLRIDAFVRPETIDPLHFDGRMYYLLPADAASHEPYAVMLDAMAREDCQGVGHLVFSGKDQMALIRPVAGLLQMSMLRYESEIRSPRKTAAAIKKPGNITREVRLAQSLIEEWFQDHLDFSKYQNAHRARVKELIDAKLRGHEIAVPPREKPEKSLNLMDALKRSMRRRAASSAGGHKHTSRRRSA